MNDASIAHPKRVQQKRTKGWTMPPNTVYVGRPSQYGNPYHLQPFCPKDMRCDHCCLTREEAIEKYRAWLLSDDYKAYNLRLTVLNALRGKDLACWCRLDQACHADVLLELANKYKEEPHE